MFKSGGGIFGSLSGVMKKALKHILFFVLFFGFPIACSTFENDPYLRTLKLPVEDIQAEDSIVLDAYELFSPDAIAALAGQWVALSSIQGENNLLFVNPLLGGSFTSIKKGRGPCEMVRGGSLHRISAGSVLYYDYYDGVCVSLAVQESLAGFRATLDTIAHFDSERVRPVFLVFNNGRFLSGNSYDPEMWYAIYDDRGDICSSISGLRYPVFRQISDELKTSIHLSSKYTIKPDGTRLCVANVATPSISFSLLDGFSMSEYKRIECAPPDLQPGRDAFSPDHRSAFQSLVSDDHAVYFLYSGHRFQNDEAPVNACTHVIVYDWDGNPKRHFRLDKYVNSIDLESGNKLVACSSFPSERVYYFNLPL